MRQRRRWHRSAGVVARRRATTGAYRGGRVIGVTHERVAVCRGRPVGFCLAGAQPSRAAVTASEKPRKRRSHLTGVALSAIPVGSARFGAGGSWSTSTGMAGDVDDARPRPIGVLDRRGAGARRRARSSGQATVDVAGVGIPKGLRRR